MRCQIGLIGVCFKSWSEPVPDWRRRRTREILSEPINIEVLFSSTRSPEHLFFISLSIHATETSQEVSNVQNTFRRPERVFFVRLNFLAFRLGYLPTW